MGILQAYIEDGQMTQWWKEKWQEDKQWSTKHDIEI
jgi:hypothetical protein